MAAGYGSLAGATCVHASGAPAPSLSHNTAARAGGGQPRRPSPPSVPPPRPRPTAGHAPSATRTMTWTSPPLGSAPPAPASDGDARARAPPTSFVVTVTRPARLLRITNAPNAVPTASYSLSDLVAPASAPQHPDGYPTALGLPPPSFGSGARATPTTRPWCFLLLTLAVECAPGPAVRSPR